MITTDDDADKMRSKGTILSNACKKCQILEEIDWHREKVELALLQAEVDLLRIKLTELEKPIIRFMDEIDRLDTLVDQLRENLAIARHALKQYATPNNNYWPEVAREALDKIGGDDAKR